MDWFERVSYALVLLGDFPLADVRFAVDAFATALEAHLVGLPPPAARRASRRSNRQDLATVVASDHEWFRTSVEQLRWFLEVVERDDHGGNRQALGQYGRVLAEAVQRHRRDERELRGQRDRPTRASAGVPRNHNEP